MTPRAPWRSGVFGVKGIDDAAEAVAVAALLTANYRPFTLINIRLASGWVHNNASWHLFIGARFTISDVINASL